MLQRLTEVGIGASNYEQNKNLARDGTPDKVGSWNNSEAMAGAFPYRYYKLLARL